MQYEKQHNGQKEQHLICNVVNPQVYSRDLILEIFSIRYVNMFDFCFVICVYGFDGLLFFPFIYFVLCGDFNFVSSYSTVETNYNMMIGMAGLLVMSVFWRCLSYMFDWPYSFCDLFALVYEVSHFICGAFRWLVGL